MEEKELVFKIDGEELEKLKRVNNLILEDLGEWLNWNLQDVVIV